MKEAGEGDSDYVEHLHSKSNDWFQYEMQHWAEMS